MKTKTPNTSNDVLLTLLRKKQSKNGISYITTQSTSYRIFRWLFFAAVIYCTIINIIFILSKSGNMAANIANMGDIMPHQQLEIDRMYATINIMVVAAAGIVLSEIFVWLKLPLLQLIFSLASSVTIVWRLSGEIFDKTSYTLSKNHIIPLAILCVLAAVTSIMHMNQLYRDKKGCNEISEIIYKKFGAVAKDISPDEWENVLAAYNPEQSASKKRSVKARLKKEELKNQAEESHIIKNETSVDAENNQ